MRNRTLLLTTLLVLLLSLAAVALWPGRDNESLRASLPAQAAFDPNLFARATGPIPLSFPADHGSHPDYQTEWWYFTGNLQAQDGRRFGYQLTFFRRALIPPVDRQARRSDFAADQAYMAHFALTDVATNDHTAFERLERGAAGLAGAQTGSLSVWLDDWRVETTADNTYRLTASQDGLALDLSLIDTKGPILQGDRGYSRKGAQPGQASYYYSLTRLESRGTIMTPGGHFTVSGWSWMDHEFSTSALEQDQVGWDWFSLQLDDGTELMLFHIRQADGSIDPFSSGTFISADGTTQPLGRADFSIETRATWKSPASGAVYPERWRVSIPSLDIQLEIQPLIADQELNVSYSYWEGAVRLQGAHNGKTVAGYGYIELTGYSASMGGEF